MAPIISFSDTAPPGLVYLYCPHHSKQFPKVWVCRGDDLDTINRTEEKMRLWCLTYHGHYEKEQKAALKPSSVPQIPSKPVPNDFKRLL